MRTVKEADERKKEILDAAARLFMEKGFDHTSANDILTAVGIAKGTLYYHFKSKEDIMDALIERQMTQILSEAQRIAQDDRLPVEERLIRTILALRVNNTAQTAGQEMIEHLHRPHNVLMHDKTKRIILQRVPPILAGIVEDGVAQGIFATPYPLECMEMAVCYLDIMLDDAIFELTPAAQLSKIRAFIFHLERLLGVAEGSLSVLQPIFLEEKETE